MARITYIAFDGAEHAVDVEVGMSVMEGAIANGIDGIDAECGGCCACATCKIYLDDTWFERLGGPDEMEEGMLEMSEHVMPNTRLSCQIPVTDALDGLVVRMPESQK